MALCNLTSNAFMARLMPLSMSLYLSLSTKAQHDLWQSTLLYFSLPGSCVRPSSLKFYYVCPSWAKGDIPFILWKERRNKNHQYTQVNSNIKYTANGYLPCNGYVPCQPGHFSPEQVAFHIIIIMIILIINKYAWRTWYFWWQTTHSYSHHQLLWLQLARRVEDAEPCHNYKDNGEGPQGCWWILINQYL